MQFDQITKTCILSASDFPHQSRWGRFICLHIDDGPDGTWVTSNFVSENEMWHSCYCATNPCWLMKENSLTQTFYRSLTVWHADILSCVSACAVGWGQGQDGWRRLNGDSWQKNGGEATQKPGYTLHIRERRRNGRRCLWNVPPVARVSGKNSKSIWSFGAERKCTGVLERYIFHFTSGFHFIFMN